MTGSVADLEDFLAESGVKRLQSKAAVFLLGAAGQQVVPAAETVIVDPGIGF
jgi:hypothetical protein